MRITVDKTQSPRRRSDTQCSCKNPCFRLFPQIAETSDLLLPSEKCKKEIKCAAERSRLL